MLGLAEYVAASAQLKQLGVDAEKAIQQAIDNDTPYIELVKLAQELGDSYHAQFQTLLNDTMREVADNAIDHYAKQLDIDPPEGLAEKVIAKQWTDKYYGATLYARMNGSVNLLQKRIKLAAPLDPKHLTTTYTSHPMFGSQNVTNQRILLGTLAKIENDVAKEMAGHGSVPFIRWTLSHRHAQTDICDDLANAVDKSVVAYLRDKGLKIDPKGLYPPDSLPHPPHPNCQCEYGMVSEASEHHPGRLQRAVSKVRQLLKKIRKR